MERTSCNFCQGISMAKADNIGKKIHERRKVALDKQKRDYPRYVKAYRKGTIGSIRIRVEDNACLECLELADQPYDASTLPRLPLPDCQGDGEGYCSCSYKAVRKTEADISGGDLVSANPPAIESQAHNQPIASTSPAAEPQTRVKANSAHKGKSRTNGDNAWRFGLLFSLFKGTTQSLPEAINGPASHTSSQPSSPGQRATGPGIVGRCAGYLSTVRLASG